MAQLIIGAEIEQLLADYLPAQLAANGFDVPVSTKQRAAEGVTLYLTGGTDQLTLVSDEPQVTFDCRAPSESRAAAMCLMVRAVVLAMYGIRLGGHQVYTPRGVAYPANLPDPNYSGARYRWTARIHIRSTVQ
jgi:hypothetical protein